MTTQTIDNTKKEIINLNLGGKIEFIPNFLSSKETQALEKHLIKDIIWVRETYNMFGKDVETPRKLSSMFDPNFKLEAVGKPWDENTKWYKAGGLWTPLVKKIVDKIEKITGRKFLYAQLNHYQDDKDYIGYHTDSEVQNDGLVVSLSIGATRRFIFRDKTKKIGQPDYEIYLPDGSLIIIDSDAIKNKYKHSLPKVRKIDNYNDIRGNGRINITFRTS